MTVPVAPVGRNPTRLWGITSAERLRRMARDQGRAVVDADRRPALLVDLGYAFDPAWLAVAEAAPGYAVTRDGAPVVAHVTVDAPDPARLVPIPQEGTEIENRQLRKRERPFMERLDPATVALLERESYRGAYKGVTDLLTKYLWPGWAFRLTRLAAAWGLSPNQVTAISLLFCVGATGAFWLGLYWLGLALALVMMVLDTVDGKLARCTVASSRWGNLLDHGIDLVHPPFWWIAWGLGLARFGRPLPDMVLAGALVAILLGYVAQRLIEGGFIAHFGIHIHVWRRFDSRFRLVTARRNPNMPILLAGLAIGRPDWGLVAVAAWTVLSLLVHLVRLGQAMAGQAAGRPVVSWLA
jgi:phosphatidylglycerophosphate synthase